MAELDRQLGSAATISAAGSTSVAALQALEQYKKRDSSKGAFEAHPLLQQSIGQRLIAD